MCWQFATSKEALVAVAVEEETPKGFGRCRMRVIPDASGATLGGFIADTVMPGARIATDGWSGYLGVGAAGFSHDRRNQSAAKALSEDAGALLPGVHRVASLVKRWLAATHQGAVEADHLQAYLAEFCFRFNRRHSAARGMLFYRVLQLAVGHDPVRYRALIATPGSNKQMPTPPGSRGQPPSLQRPPAQRPWRQPH